MSNDILNEVVLLPESFIYCDGCCDAFTSTAVMLNEEMVFCRQCWKDVLFEVIPMYICMN